MGCNSLQGMEALKNGWQDIASAAKDGTVIEVYLEAATVPIVHLAWWDDVEAWKQMGFDRQEDASGWWTYPRNSVMQDKVNPIYWRTWDGP